MIAMALPVVGSQSSRVPRVVGRFFFAGFSG